MNYTFYKSQSHHDNDVLYNMLYNDDQVHDDLFPSMNSTAGSSILADSMLSLLIRNDILDPINDTTTSHVTKHLTVEQMFSSVHGGRNMHRGVQATIKLLDERYPGHTIPQRMVSDMVSLCNVCQKARLRHGYSYPEEILHHKPPHIRSLVGVDTLTITPTDKNGNNSVIVVVEIFAKWVSLYPASDKTAETMARALWQHAVRCGRFDHIISDPGSDLMSQAVIQLNVFLGQDKLVSSTDRHESCGVEPTNKKILG